MIAEKANEEVMKSLDRKKKRQEQSSTSSKRQNTKLMTGVCFNCGLAGHQVKDCPKDAKDSTPKAVSGVCFRCGQAGHQVKDCPKDAKDSTPKAVSGVCYCCRQAGHQVKDCPKVAKGSAPKAGSGLCFRCSQEGHRAKHCPKVAKDSALSASASASVRKPTIFESEILESERKKEEPRRQARAFSLIPGDTSVTESDILGKMERQAPYADLNINPYVAQLQQIDTQTIQQNAGMNNFPGGPDSVPADKVHPFVPSKAVGHWQWARDAPRVSNPMSGHVYTEGQGGNATRLPYQGHDPNVDLERAKESRLQIHELNMEIGYEDKSSPLTFESLEQKFLDEIIKLEREQGDAEDAENARHREEITGIKTQYQEKLSALRASQTKRREEFLRREAQERLHQYHQAELNLLRPTNLGPIDPRGYSEPAAAEAHRTYAADLFESYRERAPYLGGGGNHGTEARVPIPEGRVYNNSSARYY